IFVVDAHTGNQKEDLRAAEMIRKLNKPVILAINKAEGKKYDHTEHEFHNLGLGEPMLTSAISGRGIGDLLDTVVDKLLKLPQKTTKITEDDFDKEIIKVAIIGKPNVGKSTLINKLSGKKAAIVSNIPGTTRDIVTTDISIGDNRIIRLTDTAGLRRSGKIEKGIEKFSSLLVVKSVSDADIVLQLLDGPDGVTSQDLHIAQIALESKVGIILVVNKWDAVEKSQTITHEFEKYLGQKFIFMPWAPKVYISALSGRRATNVIEEIKNVWESLHTKIPAKDLNNLIIDAVASLPPRGRRKPPKIYFSHQINTNPPTIELKINFPEEIHSSYIRYLDKKIRAKYPLPGAPIDWKLTKSSTKDVL
ncbi:MAG: ribosome biogenesis GTPase Der, partial [Patescibacteria group bacterium]|nr:ribosome biogenesis GTPase Der [Patescibacteria group bacterium]